MLNVAVVDCAHVDLLVNALNICATLVVSCIWSNIGSKLYMKQHWELVVCEATLGVSCIWSNIGS